MRIALLFGGALLLAGCGSEPNPPEPRIFCTKQSYVMAGRVAQARCEEWEYRCIKPLEMVQEESGKLVCRLPKQ
jgi:hypothetical protein